MRRRLIVALIAGLAGCSEPIDIVVLEPEVRSSTGISLGTMSFFFPVGLTFDGATETCLSGASECPLGDDSVHLVWRSGDLRFDYVLDHFGKAMVDDQWGDPITINSRPAFRKHLADGGTRYLITNHHDGRQSAAVAIWNEEEEPIFWGTCHSDADCDAVLQTLASVTMRNAEQECRLMFPQPPPPIRAAARLSRKPVCYSATGRPVAGHGTARPASATRSPPARRANSLQGLRRCPLDCFLLLSFRSCFQLVPLPALRASRQPCRCRLRRSRQSQEHSRR